ncbi:MAG: class A beta-lactamase-related serine hydrolase [candidate division Zixibacteria bacterium]|nr:class A beta-lactamase-related serine hydrolase [candidate division Zixibacteria bacterium]
MRTIACALTVFLWFPPANTMAERQSSFEKEIQQYAKEFGGRVGVAAKSMATGESILINADTLFPTASVIKLPVLVELFYQFHGGKLSPGQPIALLDSVKKPGSGILQFLHGGQTLQLIDIATLMIILSDNTATNYVIDQLGNQHDEKLEAVNNRMRSLGLKNTKLLNKLYSFATKKKTEEAQRFGIGVSCPKDMMVLLEKIVRGDIISKSSSDSIIAIMRKQQDFQQAARLLPFAEDTTLWIANKTGSLDDRKIDAGIVSSSRGTYVFAIFCDNSQDLGEHLDNKATLAVAKISRLLYDHFIR